MQIIVSDIWKNYTELEKYWRRIFHGSSYLFAATIENGIHFRHYKRSQWESFYKNLEVNAQEEGEDFVQKDTAVFIIKKR